MNTPELACNPISLIIEHQPRIPINPIKPPPHETLPNKLRPLHPEGIRRAASQRSVNKNQMTLVRHSIHP